MSNHIFKSTKDLTDAVSGHVFKFTKDKANDASGNIFKSAKDKTDNVSSSQPLPSIEPLSPPRHSTIISSTQPLPATIKHDDNSEASNQDPTNNRRNISIQEIDSVQQSLAHNSIRDDLVNSLDARQATPEFSRRTNYDNREELLGKRSRHYRSDHVDDILLSLSRPKNYDDIYTDYDRNERIRSTMQAKIDSLIKENMAVNISYFFLEKMHLKS
ncbi:hypothetical protein BD770DRAFT_142748 [Pilaira anomala]|nr:hypothetical protein BD770DRAFT_142748 [Pilaira anomala]